MEYDGTSERVDDEESSQDTGSCSTSRETGRHMMAERKVQQVSGDFHLHFSAVQQELARHKRQIDDTHLRSARSWDSLLALGDQFAHIASEMDYIRSRRHEWEEALRQRRDLAFDWEVVPLAPQPTRHASAVSLILTRGLMRLLPLLPYRLARLHEWWWCHS